MRIKDTIKNIFNVFKNNLDIIYIIIVITMSVLTIGMATVIESSLITFCIINILSIIYMLYTRIKQKRNCIEINNALDISCLLLFISPWLSLMFKTYASLSNAIIVGAQYFTLCVIYFIIKDILKHKKQSSSYVLNVIMILSIPILFFGIDLMTTNSLTWLCETLGYVNIKYEEVRMTSIFSYPNTLGTFMCATFFIAISRIELSSKRSTKIIAAICVMASLVGIVLSYSRLLFIVFGIVYITYLFCLKEKEKITRAIILSIFIGIVTLIYTSIFMDTLQTNQYYITWLATAIVILITPGIYIITNLLTNKLEKIKTRYLFLILILLVIAVVAYITCTINISTKIELFNTKNSSTYFLKEIYDVTPNAKYTFKIDLKSVTKGENPLTIVIVEKDKEFDTIKKSDFEIDDFEGTREISIDATERTKQIFVYFQTKDVGENTSLVLNKMYMNDKEVILKYKYLPTALVNKINNIKLSNYSSASRFDMINSGLQFAKENILTGAGGNGWKYKITETQNYQYVVNVPHGYPLNIICDYGMIGLIGYIGITICIIVHFIKKWLKSGYELEILCVLMVIASIWGHSMLELSLSYFSIQVITFALLAMVSNNMRITFNNKKTVKIVALVIWIISIILSALTAFYSFEYNVVYKKYITSSNENVDVQEEKFEYYSKILPFSLDTRNAYLTVLKYNERENFEKIDIEFQHLLSKEPYDFTTKNITNALHIYTMHSDEMAQNASFEEKIEMIYNCMVKTQMYKKYFADEQITRLEKIPTGIDKVCNLAIKDNNKEIAQMAIKLYKQIQNEIEMKRECILDYEKSKYDSSKVEYYENKLNVVNREIEKNVNKLEKIVSN